MTKKRSSRSRKIPGRRLGAGRSNGPGRTGAKVTARVRGLGELLALVPYQLGFDPGKSIVALVISGGVLRGLARLPEHEEGWDAVPSEAWGAVAQTVQTAWLRGAARPSRDSRGADGAILVAYDLPLEEAWQACLILSYVCALAGVPVCDEVTVVDGRWCRLGEERSGTREAVPAPADVPAVSEFVGLGIAPVKDRDGLRARFAEDPDRSGPVAEALEAIRSGRIAVDVSLGVRAIGEWLTSAVAADSPQDCVTTAQGLLLLEQPMWRDAIYDQVAPALTRDVVVTALEQAARSRIPQCAGQMDAMLADVAPAAPAGDRSHLLTIAAVAAWAEGRGSTAWAAAEMALEDDPTHGMANTVRTCLWHGLSVDPAEWGLRRSA